MPEMLSPAILHTSMPSTAGATMSNAAFQRFVTLSMRNAIYIFREKYTRWGAVFPGNFVPVLTCEGKCSCWRAKPAHFIGHLPLAHAHAQPGRLAPDLPRALSPSLARDVEGYECCPLVLRDGCLLR